MEDMLPYCHVRQRANRYTRTHHKFKGVDLGCLVYNQPFDWDEVEYTVIKHLWV